MDTNSIEIQLRMKMTRGWKFRQETFDGNFGSDGEEVSRVDCQLIKFSRLTKRRGGIYRKQIELGVASGPSSAAARHGCPSRV